MKDPEVANQEINSFLIRPIQRIPRYLLLLRDLVKHTETSHKDYDALAKALQQIGEGTYKKTDKKGKINFFSFVKKQTSCNIC